MSDQKHTFAAPVKAPDCWDWIRPEDVVRHALAAFYWACNNVKAPKGERFSALMVDPTLIGKPSRIA